MVDDIHWQTECDIVMMDAFERCGRKFIEVGSCCGGHLIRTLMRFPEVQAVAFEANSSNVAATVHAMEFSQVSDRCDLKCALIANVTGPQWWWEATTYSKRGNMDLLVQVSSMFEPDMLTLRYPWLRFNKSVGGGLRLDSFDACVGASVLVLDCCGSELAAMQGLGKLWDGIVAVIVSWDERGWWRGTPSRAQIKEYMQRRGYDLIVETQGGNNSRNGRLLYGR